MKDAKFYIGYRSSAPPLLARFLRRWIAALMLAGAVLAAALAILQKPFDPGHYEFGVVRDFSGLLLETPVPTLLVANPTQAGNPNVTLSRYLLVVPGKFGAEELVAGLHGRSIEVQGSLIQRGKDTMIELVPDSIREAVSVTSAGPSTAMDLGRHTVVGEIVDSKCYLGVMKPGREKTHRACAVRCISGGVPPMLRITTVDGELVHLLLVASDGGEINKRILDFVAEPVEVSGVIQRLEGQLVLLIDPGSIRRLRG